MTKDEFNDRFIVKIKLDTNKLIAYITELEERLKQGDKDNDKNKRD